jgi:hypothetical protein
MISWVATHLAQPTCLCAIPHSQPAQKGFDNIILELNSDRTVVEAVVISEDKATENARNTITQKVWPEISDLESGRRDHELVNEVTAILETHPAANVDACISSIFWEKSRKYRVTITTAGQDDERHRREVFSGYEANAPGDIGRRRAETIYLDDIRRWMDAFCEKVIRFLWNGNV